jgi:hypothetical protein
VASKPKPRRRGFDQGGQISSNSLGNSISQGMNTAFNAYSAFKRAQLYDAMADAAKAKLGSTGPAASGATSGATGGDTPGAARGGKIRRVAGRPIGKDDGVIPAQKGEYVVRKSAVNKLGTKALNTINKGKLPAGKGRGR